MARQLIRTVVYNPNDKEQVWDNRWLDVALQVATWSKDPSTKCGAVIVQPDNRIVSVGYNGFAEGVEDTDERWTRPEKYEWVIHAEMNAILNVRSRDMADCTLYITTQPCHRCLQHIINTGIKKVVWLAPDEEFVQRWISGDKARIIEETLDHCLLEIAVYK